jgi:hypothetical protein
MKTLFRQGSTELGPGLSANFKHLAIVWCWSQSFSRDASARSGALEKSQSVPVPLSHFQLPTATHPSQLKANEWIVLQTSKTVIMVSR